MKFGGITGIPELVFFPSAVLMWFYGSWPVILFPFFSSLLLISVLMISGSLKPDGKMFFALLWLLLAFASLIGFINATVLDFPVQYVLHFLGIALFVFSVYRIIEMRPDLKNWFIYAIVFSSLISALIGLNQYFSGFKETLDYVRQQEASTGMKIPEQLLMRLVQVRVFSPFTLCNSFAAHMILTIPLCIVAIWKDTLVMKVVVFIFLTAILISIFNYLSPFSFFIVAFMYLFLVALILFKIPQNSLRRGTGLAVVATLLIMAGALYLSGSRAAIVGLGLALCVTIVLFPFNFRLRLGAGVLILLGFCAAYYFVNAGRDLGSMTVRFDYFKVALKMFASNVFTGIGWGDFFHEYMMLKTFPGTEAPHSAHNFVLDFASQTGFSGLIISMAILLFPAFLVIREIRRKSMDFLRNPLTIAVFLGCAAWGFHSLADINMQIPGSITTAALMILLIIPERKLGTEKVEARSWNKVSACIFMVLILTALGTLFASYKRIRGELAFSTLQEMCEPALVSPEKMNVRPPLSEVEKVLGYCTREMPYSPYPWSSVGTYAQSAGAWSLSEGCFKKAVELSPLRSSFYSRLCHSQMMLGKRTEALENAKKASELFPNCQEYRDDYGKIRDLEQQEDKRPKPSESQ